jgi:hypothetical protein
MHLIACPSTVLFIYCTVHLLYCSSTVLFIYRTVHLLYCSSTVLSIYCTVHLPYCSSTVLFIYCTLYLLHCSSTVLFIYCTVHLLYCSSTVLFIYCTHVIHIFTSLFVVYLMRIWDSSVSIVTGPQAGQSTYRGSNPRRDKIFSFLRMSKPALRPNQWVARALPPVIKRAAVWLMFTCYKAVFKNERSYTSNPKRLLALYFSVIS